MNRGEVWTVSGAPGYAGKSRPVIVVQADGFSETESVVVCGVTTDPDDRPLFRLPVEPTTENGLRLPSRLMVDKINAVPRSKLGQFVGRLSDADLLELNRALVVFLGLASATG